MALPKKTKVAISLLMFAVVLVSGFYLRHHEADASTQSTTDAYVQADFTSVAPQVSGIIDNVLVHENQTVETGDVLATIDDRDFIIAVQAAKAQVASAQANIDSLEASLVQQKSVIHQAQATLAANEAELKLAKRNEARYRRLASDGLGAIQASQQAEANLAVQLANREKNQASLLASRQKLHILQANLDNARAALAQAQASMAASELNLSRTRIVAPISGIVGWKSVRVGAFGTTGRPLLSIVPLHSVYVAANYRETQLARIRKGQRVDITVDALPRVVLHGTVESLGPASGVSYSAIAPHNATGNFTKIVQRIPVRIQINSDQAAAGRLRVGMSVTPKIYIDG